MRNNKIPQPTVYHYVLDRKFGEVWHYNLLHCSSNTPELTPRLNISLNRNFAKSKPIYWIRERLGNKWTQTCTTGLFKTIYPNVYRGDLNRKKDLVIASQNIDSKTIRIFVFPDYFSYDLEPVFEYLIRTNPK